MVAVLLFSASSLEAAKFSVPAIIGFRLLAVAAFAALLAYALMPLRRQVTDTLAMARPCNSEVRQGSV